MDDYLTEHYDALDEIGRVDDPQAWTGLDRVREQLAEYGRTDNE